MWAWSFIFQLKLWSRSERQHAMAIATSVQFRIYKASLRLVLATLLQSWFSVFKLKWALPNFEGSMVWIWSCYLNTVINDIMTAKRPRSSVQRPALWKFVRPFLSPADQRPGISPTELVELLNMLYSAFDETILDWGLHKVEACSCHSQWPSEKIFWTQRKKNTSTFWICSKPRL